MNSTKHQDDDVIDWELCLKLAGDKPDLAKDILTILVKTLPAEMYEIRQARSNLPELLRNIHRLHGAVSYCGVPRLKRILVELEAALKKHEVSRIEGLYNAFEYEVKELLEQAPRPPCM